MNQGILYDLANYMLYFGMFGVLLFTLLYGLRSRWWVYIEGRALFASKVTLSLVSMNVAAALWLGSDYPGRNIVRFIVYGLFMLSAWFFTITLIRRQHQAATERDRLLVELQDAKVREGIAPVIEAPVDVTIKVSPRRKPLTVTVRRKLREWLDRD